MNFNEFNTTKPGNEIYIYEINKVLGTVMN